MNKSLELPKFSDGSVKFYKITTIIENQSLAPGVWVAPNVALLGKALLMWREEKHYMKRLFGQAPEDLGSFYIVSWQPYGPGYYGRDDALKAIEYYQQKGWSLVASDRKTIPVDYWDSDNGRNATRDVFVGNSMKALPKNWAEVNAKVIERMDEKPSDNQVKLFHEMNKKSIEDLIRAIKEGKL